MSIHRYETSDGTRWRVRWRDPDGRLRSKTLSRKSDAQAFDLDLKVRKQRAELLPQLSPWSLDRAWAEWKKTRGADLAAATMESYEALWDAYIDSTLGAFQLVRLVNEPKLIEDHFADLAEHGVGPSSRRKLLMVLSGVFKACVHWRLVPVNPVRDMKKPAAAPERIARPLHPLVVERIRGEITSRDVQGSAWTGQSGSTLVSLLSYAGLRPQEALALRYSDVGQRTIGIDKALRLTDEGMALGPTKTRRARHVPIPEVLRDDIAGLRRAQGDPPSHAHLFAGPSDEPWTRSEYARWRREVWRDALGKLSERDEELEPIAGARPYDCRGSYVSLQLRAGVPPIEVAQAAGHSLQVMFKHYAKVIDDLVGEPILAADEQIKRARLLIEQQTPSELTATTAESLKPPKEARPQFRGILYGERVTSVEQLAGDKEEGSGE